MIGLLSPEEIESLLKRHRVGRIGVCLDDRPYVVPINYAYDGTDIYTASGPGQKIDAMRARPRICLQIDEIDTSGTWRSVIADGVYEELAEDDARRAVLAQLGPTWAGQAGRGLALPAAIIVFRIRLLAKTGRFGREGIRGAHGSAWPATLPVQAATLPARAKKRVPRDSDHGDDPAAEPTPRSAILRSGRPTLVEVGERR